MTGPGLPFAPASERNKGPILAALRGVLPARGRLLEIGAGTGQHAVFFAPAFPGLTWQVSDRAEALPGLQARLDAEGQSRLPDALSLDVLHDPWPRRRYQAVYSANTAHIMPWRGVVAMFLGTGRLLASGGSFCLYGPFNAGGAYTAPSNAAFDQQLQAENPAMGLRDIEELERLAGENRLALEQRLVMPANNFLLVFRRQ